MAIPYWWRMPRRLATEYRLRAGGRHGNDLKKRSLQGGKRRPRTLQPAKASMQPIFVDKSSVAIQGKAGPFFGNIKGEGYAPSFF